MTLHLALTRLMEAGQQPPCADLEVRDRWTSDTNEDREWAGRTCQRCPLADVCLRDALERREKHHVWGGHDFGRLTRTQRARLEDAYLNPESEPTPALF